MAASEEILSAVRCNWWLNAVGIVLSYGASIILVRHVSPDLFAQYSAMLAIMGLATLIFEGGANSGLTRYFTEASRLNARGTFYRRMQRKRLFAAGLCVSLLVAFGPLYAQYANYRALSDTPGLFAMIGGIVVLGLYALLAHYGLLAMFDPGTASLYQQGFFLLRSVVLAGTACAGGHLVHLAAGLLVISAAQAYAVHRSIWKRIGGEREAMPEALVARAQTFGLATVFDKLCAMLGSGSVAYLVFAPYHDVAQMALLALALDLVGKLVSFTVLPMSNLIGPYLGQTHDAAHAQGLAASRIIKLSSVLYSVSVGLGLLVLPGVIVFVYGSTYAGASIYALLLLIPTAFENWVRSCCSPVLLRNDRYRQLIRINVFQALLTLLTLAAVVSLPLEIALLCLGLVRGAVTALNLVSLRGIIPRGTYRVPLQAAFLSGGGVALALGLGVFLPDSLRLVVQTAFFAAVFYLGTRQLILRDEDTLRILHRIFGGHFRFLNRLLPARSVPSA